MLRVEEIHTTEAVSAVKNRSSVIFIPTGNHATVHTDRLNDNLTSGKTGFYDAEKEIVEPFPDDYECLSSEVCILKLLTEEIWTHFCLQSDDIQAGSTLTYLNISVPLSGSPLPCRICAICLKEVFQEENGHENVSRETLLPPIPQSPPT